MKVELIGQARRVFEASEIPGHDWDELMMETWATLDLIRRGQLAADARGRRAGVICQYVRSMVDDRRQVATSSRGTGYVLIGRMVGPNPVVYHRIAPWTQT